MGGSREWYRGGCLGNSGRAGSGGFVRVSRCRLIDLLHLIL